jgi:hypothetical protein
MMIGAGNAATGMNIGLMVTRQAASGMESWKKTGWGNCGLAPGQAKKYGCRSYTYQRIPHYYYQDEQGQIIVRRPLIEVHGSIDVVP